MEKLVIENAERNIQNRMRPNFREEYREQEILCQIDCLN